MLFWSACIRGWLNKFALIATTDAPEQPTQSAVAKLAAQHGEEVGEQEMQSLVNEMLNPESERKRLIQ